MAKFAIMQMFHLVAIFATNAILKLKRQYPGSVVPLAMFLPFFAERGGVWAESKKSLTEKTEVVKKGGGGGSQFF